MKKSCLILLCIMLFSGSALADWDVNDDYKMHFPQLPDPTGWDVYGEYPIVLADDWLCIGSGPVLDIHFWGSWKEDVEGVEGTVHVSIHEDDRTDSFSKPGAMLWEHNFQMGEYTVRQWGSGDQGWYDPTTGQYIENDHQLIWQYNIEDIPDPFYQEQGQIYWLDISMEFEGCYWGWKTSIEHFEDDAVWGFLPDGGWQELRDPVTGESLDLAFVITPEPTTFLILGFGWLILSRCKE